jgi:hypothetical protein
MRSFDAEPVEVRLEACWCPGTPHEADLVYLAPSISMAGGLAARAVVIDEIDQGVDPIRLQERLAQVWVRHGIVGWNLVDEAGEPVALTEDNVRAALPYGKGGRLVADKADDLYNKDIMDPLVAMSRSSSPRGRTNGSTSATPRSTRRRRSPSSTATTGRAPRPG